MYKEFIISFMAQNMLYLCECSIVGLERGCEFEEDGIMLLLLHGIFYKCQLDQVYFITVQVNYILTDSLRTWSTNYWHWDIAFSNYNSKLIYFPF